MNEISEYKLFRQIESQNKRRNPYKFYDNDELIDTILENEDEIERLNNIIKEVREYIKNIELGKGTEYYRIQILQILNKVDKGE